MDQIFPGCRLQSLGIENTKNSDEKKHVLQADINVPIKGNASKIELLMKMGWIKRSISVRGGKKMQCLSYDLKNRG